MCLHIFMLKHLQEGFIIIIGSDQAMYYSLIVWFQEKSCVHTYTYLKSKVISGSPVRSFILEKWWLHNEHIFFHFCLSTGDYGMYILLVACALGTPALTLALANTGSTANRSSTTVLRTNRQTQAQAHSHYAVTLNREESLGCKSSPL